MNKTIFAASAALFAMAAMPAAAQDWYAQVNAGLTFEGEADIDATISDGVDSEDVSGKVDLESGFAVGAAGGLALGNGVRVELEGIYNESEIDGLDELDVPSINVQNAAALVNVLYDIPMESFSPYVGAGFGYGSTTLEVDGDSVHDQGTVWQVRAGATFPVNETLTLDVGYRYMEMAEFDESVTDGVLTASLNAEPSVHAVTVGARFKLGNAS